MDSEKPKKPRRPSRGGHPSSWIRREKRHRIYRRDKYVCVYCLRWLPTKHLTLDHVVPRTNGGHNDPSNLVTACLRCNSSLQHKTLKEWCALTGRDLKAIRRRIRNAIRRRLPE